MCIAIYPRQPATPCHKRMTVAINYCFAFFYHGFTLYHTFHLWMIKSHSRKVVQLNESNRKGKLSRWRKALLKKNDRERKRKEKCRKERPHGGVARKNNKGIAICSMMRAAKPNHSPTERDAVRNYITQHVPGTHLTFEQRQTLASDWNRIINAGCRITLWSHHGRMAKKRKKTQPGIKTRKD